MKQTRPQSDTSSCFCHQGQFLRGPSSSPCRCMGTTGQRCPWVYPESCLLVYFASCILYMTPVPHPILTLSLSSGGLHFWCHPAPTTVLLSSLLLMTPEMSCSVPVSVTGFASLFSHHPYWMGSSREAQPVLPRTSLVWQPIPRHSSKQYLNFWIWWGKISVDKIKPSRC